DDLPVVTHIGFSVFRPRGEELLFIVWFQAFEKGNAGRAKLRPAYIGQWQACPSLDSEAFRKGVASSSKVIAEEVAVLTSTVVQK
ncbi:MAG TPA: hypothetical protein VKO42_03545, partial [Patescibacteria group bacterium]|nr:hypothetical protein [Patescibacteria group bacterium]